MNTNDTVQSPEFSVQSVDLDKAERTIIDRAEFARLIRKHRGVVVYVFSSDRSASVLRNLCGCFSLRVSAKQALEKLENGAFDAFTWALTQYGLEVEAEIAPMWLQLRRRREQVVSNIAWHESRLAQPVREADAYDTRARSQYAGLLAQARAELATIDAELAPKPATTSEDYAKRLDAIDDAMFGRHTCPAVAAA